MSDGRLRAHLETILREIEQALSEQMEELQVVQGSSDSAEGLYDPMGLHQKNIDDLKALREAVKKRIKDAAEG